MKDAQLAKTYFTWFVFFNWPGIIIGILLLWPTLVESIPFLGLLVFLPGLFWMSFWMNIPAVGLGLAEILGKPHFYVQEFGAMPRTPLAFLSIFMSWALAAAVMTGLTVLVRNWLYRDMNIQVPSNRDDESLAAFRESLRQ